jgi:hypothetical protein
MLPDNEESKRTDILKEQMKIYFDVYKHHIELFFKVITVYLAAVSAIVLYFFNKDVSLSIKK